MGKINEGHLKKFLLVIIALSIMTAGYKYFAEYYSWGTSAKSNELVTLEEERATLEYELEELQMANDEIQYQIEIKSNEVVNDETHEVSETDNYTTENEKQLREDVEALKKDSKLISNEPFKNQVIHTVSEIYGEYEVGTDFGVNENYKLSEDNENHIYTLISNEDRNDKMDIFILGPWGMSVNYHNDTMNNYLEFAGVEEGLGITPTVSDMLEAIVIGEE